MELKDMRKVESNCWALFLYDCYTAIPDSPVELIDEGDHQVGSGTIHIWMVVLPDRFPCPPGFERLQHFSDVLPFWGKDFDSLDEALKVYEELHKKYGRGRIDST